MTWLVHDSVGVVREFAGNLRSLRCLDYCCSTNLQSLEIGAPEIKDAFQVEKQKMKTHKALVKDFHSMIPEMEIASKNGEQKPERSDRQSPVDNDFNCKQ